MKESVLCKMAGRRKLMRVKRREGRGVENFESEDVARRFLLEGVQRNVPPEDERIVSLA